MLLTSGYRCVFPPGKAVGGDAHCGASRLGMEFSIREKPVVKMRIMALRGWGWNFPFRKKPVVEIRATALPLCFSFGAIGVVRSKFAMCCVKEF